MIFSKPLISRRRFLALTAATAGSRFLPAYAEGKDAPPNTIPPSSTLFYKPARTGNIWDTWIYHFEGTFYLYYNPMPSHLEKFEGWNGIGLATSDDGVHWREYGMVIEPVPNIRFLGAGAVWSAGEKFIMNFSEWRDKPDGSFEQTIFFAESSDLINWHRLGRSNVFRPDPRWYDAKGRWDNIWSVPRPTGGYYGYWASTPTKHLGLGFGESDDGITWKALAPPLLEGLSDHPHPAYSPEVNAVYMQRGRYYALLGLDGVKPIWKDKNTWHPGVTTFVSDSASGPFRPALKNHKLLVNNSSSYFLRFVDAGKEVLANHHSWEREVGRYAEVNPHRTYMAPLKKAHWDEEGTLRLKWWEGNNKAKANSVSLASSLNETAFDSDEALILEGVISLSSIPTGLFLQGSGEKGTGFLVHDNGLVEYGDINRDGSRFEKKGDVDRELTFRNEAHFRLIRKGQLTEFYLNDYLMQCYSLPARGTGRIYVIGPADNLRQLKAWYCS